MSYPFRLFLSASRKSRVEWAERHSVPLDLIHSQGDRYPAEVTAARQAFLDETLLAFLEKKWLSGTDPAERGMWEFTPVASRPRRVLGPNAPEHGTSSGYKFFRCRCDECVVMAA